MNNVGLSKTFGCIVILANLVSCTQAKQMTSMHDATLDMREQTKTMNERMDKMQRTTDDMAKLTQALGLRMDEMSDLAAQAIRVAKQGVSMELRRQLLKDMREAQSQSAKISLAAKYFMAFEYQLWSGTGLETEEARLDLAATAAQEFMLDIEPFLRPGQKNVSPTSSPEMALLLRRSFEIANATARQADAEAVKNGTAPRTEQEIVEATRFQQEMLDTIELESSMNALAVAMFKLNPIQEIEVQSGKVKTPMSMLTMIEDAIKAKKLIESGTQPSSAFPRYIHEILLGEKKALILLQARQQSFSFLALVKVSKFLTDEEEKGKMTSSAWPMTTDTLNTQELREVATFLKEYKSTVEFLEANGIKPQTDSDIAKAWKNAVLTDEFTTVSSTGRGSRGEAIAELVGLLGYVRR